ncbi:MAG: DUF551 domain-containing protein, partial [Eubacterium sp.]|nr:DUF551 domain-containing protein [Eubacterium sp.]
MKAIDGDALDDFLASAEIEAVEQKKYVLAGALNTIRGNLLNFPAIELEENSMGRLIDADEYEQRIKPYDTEDVMDKALYNFAHGKLITTSTAQQWIPCSERLPERDEIVLVSYKTTDNVHMCKYLDDGSENTWWSYN